MEELIAKKYVKALVSDVDASAVQTMSDVFSALGASFQNPKMLNIINDPYIADTDKEAILLDAVKGAGSDKLNNFVKLLVENKRIQIIPAIAEELRKNIAAATKNFKGQVYSDTPMDPKVVEALGERLSKKYDSTIVLDFVQNDFNGIKVSVEDLGIEINFSKDRIDGQIIQHIIKAI